MKFLWAVRSARAVPTHSTPAIATGRLCYQPPVPTPRAGFTPWRPLWRGQSLMAEPNALLRVENLNHHFDVSPPALERLLQRKPRATLKAVDGISFTIGQGETFALVGES